MINYSYRDRGTVLYRLNPLIKLAWVVSLLVLALVLDHPLYLLTLFAVTLPLVHLGRLWREWLQMIKFIIYLSLLVVLLNALASQQGSTVLFSIPLKLPLVGEPVITLEAVIYGLVMSLRLLVIISAFTVVTFTVHPDDFFQVMLRVKLPYRSVLVATLATRFLPSLVSDARQIADVERTRGVEMDEGNFFRRSRNQAMVLLPLLANSLDRAVQLSEAMETKAFSSSTQRTCYYAVSVRWYERLVVALFLLPVVAGVWLRLVGGGSYSYYPVLASLNLDTKGWLSLMALALLLVAIVPFTFLLERMKGDSAQKI